MSRRPHAITMRNRLQLSVLTTLLLGACGDGGRDTADVVQAATKGLAEAGQQLAEKTAELAHTTPEQARAKLQGLIDAAARSFEEIKDSETAQKVAANVEKALDVIVALGVKLGQELHLAELQTAVERQFERFKNDPHVTSALESVKTKLHELTQ